MGKIRHKHIRHQIGGLAIYIDNTDGVENLSHCIRRGRLFAAGPVEGPQATETGSAANGLPRRILRVRVLYNGCIVFISPPGVELCVFGHVLCVFCAS